MTVVPQRLGGVHHYPNQQLFEVGHTMKFLVEVGEEVFEFGHPHGFEQHIFPAGEHAIQGGARHACLGRDVVDGDLGNAPALATALGGIEDSTFDRRHH